MEGVEIGGIYGSVIGVKKEVVVEVSRLGELAEAHLVWERDDKLYVY